MVDAFGPPAPRLVRDDPWLLLSIQGVQPPDADRVARAALPGVSAGRSTQLTAGALVADAVMDLFDLPALEVCPWALREGVILSRLDQLQPR